MRSIHEPPAMLSIYDIDHAKPQDHTTAQKNLLNPQNDQLITTNPAAGRVNICLSPGNFTWFFRCGSVSLTCTASHFDFTQEKTRTKKPTGHMHIERAPQWYPFYP